MEEKTEVLEMAKALYNFKATIAKTLSFRESDYFIIYQSSTKQKNWWQVINCKAQVGYVPSNYVISVQVLPDFMTKFVDDCIYLLRKESDKAKGCLPSDRQEVLLKLLERKNDVEKLISRRESNTSFTKEMEFSSMVSTCSSVSRISPPLLLNSQTKIKHYPSTPSFLSNAKNDADDDDGGGGGGKKTEILETRSYSSLGQTSGPLTKERSTSRETVSDISGQIGTPFFDSKKTVPTSCSRRESSVEESRSLPSSRKNSQFENEIITKEIVYQIVEQVRCHTELSHDLSKVAVNVVISELQKLMPNSPIFDKILQLVQNPIVAPMPIIEDTHDAKRLKIIFSELTSCKDDAQQRSWMLHEDEAVIVEYVKELTSILMNADSNISRHVISNDQYSGVLALVQYYQMETRWSIRQPLLQALGVLCSLDRAIISIFLSSVLPMELARDMKTNPRNIPRLNYSSLLLTMIFSMGEPMPINHLEHLGSDFIDFLLNHIENPPDTDVEDQVPDLFIALILSYNLQFKNSQDNVVVKSLSQRPVAKVFTEKILLLLNREDDPVRIFEHEPAPRNSILKIFIDIFSHRNTANLFYTNDVKVLIDIIVRQLADLSPDDQRRNQYLQLCKLVMRNSEYSEHHHRKDDLSKCFTRIFCEETEISLKDQQLVREISNEFPQYFK
ncbi:conserved hypothetical protein [Pediculus humanus corporis]|uniref:SH3 domain-containing protein n=1 Tax=Pediculus humanus subsp. corporis TaxID=121224 RepID=E0VPZ9_PEDHC|nr:uncharacterized protein Phum_PHUM369520 [Pediculus humanus corporis]EEB15455.1 conserved hypothetical protein [Pediculus humanus corporis]